MPKTSATAGKSSPSRTAQPPSGTRAKQRKAGKDAKDRLIATLQDKLQRKNKMLSESRKQQNQLKKELEALKCLSLPPETKKNAKAACNLDQIVQEVDSSIENLHCALDKLHVAMPDLVAREVHRDRLRLIKNLAEDGILDNFQRLGKALENAGSGSLPESVVPLHRSVRITLERICRDFEVQPVYQPGEVIGITEVQANDFDWSVYHSERTFPMKVEIVRSGWRADEGVFVLPRIRFRSPSAEPSTTNSPGAPPPLDSATHAPPNHPQ